MSLKNVLKNLPLNRLAYSDRVAYMMAECSKIAYAPHKAGLLKRLHLTPVSSYGSNFGNQAYLALNTDFAVLAFKGTVPHEISTVETDLDVKLVHSRYGSVHRGFLDALKLMRWSIEQDLKKLKVPVFITGHSLGGALALLASIFLKDEEHVAACYTFGCPRVGTDQLVDCIFKVPVYRVIHHADVVPAVPLLIMGYRSYGDVRYLADDGTVCEGGEASAKRLLASLNPLNLPRWVADHAVDKYVRILQVYAESRNP